MNILIDDIHGSFSKQVPDLHYLNPYNKLYKKVGKAKYDTVMMGIYLVYDPKSSSGKNSRPEEEMQEDIAKNFLKKPRFKWDDFKEYIEAYKLDTKTKLQKMLDELEQDVNNRAAFGRQLDWETDFKTKNEIVKTQDEFVEKFMQLKAKVDEEAATSGHGKQRMSRMERKALDAKKNQNA